MQPHEKSVNLFASCLFSLSGSTKTLYTNKHEWVTLERVNFRNLILVYNFWNLVDFDNKRIRALAQLFS